MNPHLRKFLFITLWLLLVMTTVMWPAILSTFLGKTPRELMSGFGDSLASTLLVYVLVTFALCGLWRLLFYFIVRSIKK